MIYSDCGFVLDGRINEAGGCIQFGPKATNSNAGRAYTGLRWCFLEIREFRLISDYGAMSLGSRARPIKTDRDSNAFSTVTVLTL